MEKPRLEFELLLNRKVNIEGLVSAYGNNKKRPNSPDWKNFICIEQVKISHHLGKATTDHCWIEVNPLLAQMNFKEGSEVFLIGEVTKYAKGYYLSRTMDYGLKNITIAQSIVDGNGPNFSGYLEAITSRNAFYPNTININKAA